MSQNFELLNQLESEFGIPEVIPEENVRIARSAERSEREFPQELVTLVHTLFLSREANAPHAVVVCGIDHANASSEICLNLGRVLAASSALRVCLVDAHLRPAALGQALTVDHPISLCDRRRDQYREVAPNLWRSELHMTSVSKQAGLRLTADVKEQVAALQQDFGFVLIDTPGVNTRAEAAVLGQLVDGIILVIEANVTRKAAALRAKDRLQQMGVRILGSVLNNRIFPIPERLYRKL